MRALRRALLAMRTVNDQIIKATKRLDHGRSGEIVTLRQEFNEACGDFIKRLQELLRDRDNIHLFVRLQDEFDEMRSALQGHQRQWTPEAIAADLDFYLKRNELIAVKVSSFVENSLTAIADDHDAVA